jgi:hypothetical protein
MNKLSEKSLRRKTNIIITPRYDKAAFRRRNRRNNSKTTAETASIQKNDT